MSEHQRETAFLRRVVLYDESDECRKLETDVARAEQDERCVQRVASVTALFPMLALAGMAYGAILPYDSRSELVIRVLCEVGLAALICLVIFASLLAVFRMKLNRLREECRQLITRRLESHPGTPRIANLRVGSPAPDNPPAFRDAAEAGG